MTEAGKTRVVEVPGWGVSISVALDKAGQRSMVFQTHVPQDMSREDINTLVDLAFAIADRQADSYRLVELVHDLRLAKKALANSKADLIRIDADHVQRWENSGKRGDPKRHPNEEANRNNVLVNIKKLEELEIPWGEQQIELLRERIKKDEY